MLRQAGMGGMKALERLGDSSDVQRWGQCSCPAKGTSKGTAHGIKAAG